MPVSCPHSCFHCESRSRTLWDSLDCEDVRILNRARVPNTYRKGQVIFYEGNACLGLHCVTDGVIGSSRNDGRGNSMLLRIRSGPQILGYRAFFSSRRYTTTTHAVRTTRLCFIDMDSIQTLLGRRPELAFSFMNLLGEDANDADKLHFQSATLSVRELLVRLLILFKHDFASGDSSGRITIDLPLKRTEIASMLGARPETVIRAMRAIERDGTARFKGSTVVIEDLDRLLDEVDPER